MQFTAAILAMKMGITHIDLQIASVVLEGKLFVCSEEWLY